MECGVGSARVRQLGCPVPLQTHTRDGSEDMRDKPFCDILDMFLKLLRQFHCPSKPNATSPPYSISPPIPAELLTNVSLSWDLLPSMWRKHLTKHRRLNEIMYNSCY